MEITIILLGGARRVTLAEQFRRLLQSVGVSTRFISLERDADFYPISEIGLTMPAPSFSDASFEVYLQDLLNKCDMPLVVACMDAALPPLAEIAMRDSAQVAPTREGAAVALDKKLTADFCEKFAIRHPICFDGRGARYSGKVIAKPVRGFGGKGIEIFEGLDQVCDEIFNTHVVQQYIDGVETTHDLYITKNGKVYASSRDRLAVIDGEVDHCIVRQPTAEEFELFNTIAKVGMFYGPVTVQTMKNINEIFLIEINSRFGGGVTASIEAGFPGCELLIHEACGIEIPHRKFRSLEMKRARRDFYRFI